jgi:hypothetical protein
MMLAAELRLGLAFRAFFFAMAEVCPSGHVVSSAGKSPVPARQQVYSPELDQPFFVSDRQSRRILSAQVLYFGKLLRLRMMAAWRVLARMFSSNLA